MLNEKLSNVAEKIYNGQILSGSLKHIYVTKCNNVKL